MTNDASTADTWNDYYVVCRVYGTVVRAVEQVLNGTADQVKTVRQIADEVIGSGCTYDQVDQVLRALCRLGVVGSPATGRYVCKQSEFAQTHVERMAVLNALTWAGSTADGLGDCELLLAAPADASHLVGAGFDRVFLDLRTSIRHLIADAKSRVLLAAPFWDLEVATDLAQLLRKRQGAGVDVAILARRPQSGSQNESALAVIHEALSGSGKQHMRILERPSTEDPFGSSTFHFKAAAGDGTTVYLGSANFNTAGLGSRWELGVRLGGRRAFYVSQLLDEIWLAAEPL